MQEMLVGIRSDVYNNSKEVLLMTLVERITEEARTLPVRTQQQVLDFVQFLRQKEQQQLEEDMDSIVLENLPAWKELAK